jgi:hypothetical protein
MKGAENKFAAVEDLSDKELEELHNDYRTRPEVTLHHITHRQTSGQRATAHCTKSSHRKSAR